MEDKDYYQILGVKRDATEKEIKRAYRQLARKHHPDVNPGKRAEERFKEINEAYEVLSDPEQRRKYDELGVHWRQAAQAGGRGPGAWGPGQTHVQYADLDDLLGGKGDVSDLLHNLLRGKGTRPTPGQPAPGWDVRGQVLEYTAQVTLEEAFHGATRTLVTDGSKVEVRIPPGVRTGSRLVVGAGGGNDIYLVVEVLPHARFTLEGHDLRLVVLVDVPTAALGGEVAVTTLKGEVLMKIPPETQSGTVLRLRGQGMPHLDDPASRGDLYAEVRIQLPPRLSEKEKDLYRQLAELRRK